MRIIHFDADSLGTAYSGGQARRTFEINRRLARRHDITVVTAGYSTLRNESVDGVRYLRTLPLPFPANFPWYFCEIIPRALMYRSDLIVEDFSVPFTASGLPAFVQRPVIGIASFLFGTQLAKRYRLPFDRWESFILRCYRHIVALTERQRRVLRGLAPRADVHVISNGADEGAFEEQWRGNGNYIAFLGRLDVDQKGLDLLLDIVQHLPEQLRVRIAGDGGGRSWLLKAIHDRGLTSRVEYLGRLEGQSRHRFLADAIAMAFPSRYENQSLVLLDALAIGVPIVAFGTEGSLETLGDSAAMVTPYDTVDFAKTLTSLAIHHDRATTLSQRARRRGEGLHWDCAAEEQEAFYQEVVQARKH